MLVHSRRTTPAVIIATSGRPCTQAYLVSQPFPADLQSVRLTITNRDQGFYSDPNARDSWTWFEASIARPLEGFTSDQNLRLTASTRSDLNDFATDIEQGFRLVPLQHVTTGREPDSISAYSLKLRTTEVPCRDWQTWSTTWTPGMDCTSSQNINVILSNILPGDHLIIWARAQYPAWQNFVKEVLLELTSPSFEESNTELYSPVEDASVRSLAPSQADVSQELHNAMAKVMAHFAPSAIPTARENLSVGNSSDTQAPSASDMVKQFANLALGVIGETGDKLQELQETQRRQENDREIWKPPNLNSPDVARFQYDTLETSGKTELRLLKVLLRDEDDEQGFIRCELTTYKGDSLPKYTALSYTWGEIAEYPILLNGRLWHIRANLLAFLLQVQQDAKHIGTNFWIDAVCINQSDTTERSIIVARMKEIYEKSHDMVIWLGPGRAEIESSFDALDSLTKLHVFSPNGDRYAPAEGEDAHARQDMPVLIERLLKHPYWHRVWILQEASTPHHISPSWVWYGSRKRMFYEFVMSLTSLSDKNRKERKHLGIHQGTALERLGYLSMQRNQVTSVQVPPITMLGLLGHARVCRCTDDRDRIYALLGVATDMDGFPIDYAKSVATVFIELARHIITKENNLDILSFTDGRRVVEGLPSWVPDWSHQSIPSALPKIEWRKRDTEAAKAEFVAKYQGKATTAAVQAWWSQNNMYNVSKGLECPQNWFKDHDMASLTVHGFEWDRVASTDAASIFLNFLSHAQEPYEHGTAHNRMEALMSTACAAVSSSTMGMHGRGIWSQPDIQAFNADPTLQVQIRMSWRTVLSKSMPGLKETILNRTLFTTSKGYIALGSDRLLPGDMICIASGAQCPLVLRPTAGGENAYEFLGDAYVHGIMDGELAADDGASKPTLREMVLI